MQKRTTALANVAMFSAYLFGAVSLSLLGLFLFFGPFNLVVLDASLPVALGLDATLCLLFFIQHSGMIRRSFQAWLGRFIADHLHGAVFTVTSGVFILALLILWQSTGPALISADGIVRLLLRGCFAAGILGFVWGVRALGSFDAFGIRPIKAHLRGKKLRLQPLAIRGPYKWVRHPLYSFVLLILWCHPDLTPDRLVLNATWTAWVFLGTVLEERDLVSVFGDPYREYQNTVPMLIPWRIPKS